ncbi:hypothetical protein BJ166DRAFT_507677 [Pestalotiopsis sp. NC0098]|nr:hypothetical protein BJ166DRAFT_507677 [Pestalotiopsis sp. NC0098]
MRVILFSFSPLSLSHGSGAGETFDPYPPEGIPFNGPRYRLTGPSAVSHIDCGLPWIQIFPRMEAPIFRLEAGDGLATSSLSVLDSCLKFGQLTGGTGAGQLGWPLRPLGSISLVDLRGRYT